MSINFEQMQALLEQQQKQFEQSQTRLIETLTQKMNIKRTTINPSTIEAALSSIYLNALAVDVMAKNMPVGIVFSNNYRQVMSLSPKFVHRFTMVMDLINAYKLTAHLVCVPPVSIDCLQSAQKELCVFHSADYVELLSDLDKDEPQLPEEDLLDSYGLSYDCPIFPGVFKYASASVCGSLAAADALIRRDCQVVINWAGGWHHSKRSEASGFCYLNDIVLAIHRLLTDPHIETRVVYIDLDLHHGDGVEEAFWYSPRVVTFSVHHASPGFFPGTGTFLLDGTQESGSMPTGAGHGRHSAFNLPLAEGCDDATWSKAVLPVLRLLHAAVRPTYVVVQCGADCLANDPHRIFNLTNLDASVHPKGEENESYCDTPTSQGSYVPVLRLILSWKLPTLLLGGGGYCMADTARLWTRLTAVAIEQVTQVKLDLDSEIPDHSFLSNYSPDFDLDTTDLPRINRNSPHVIAAHHARLLDQAHAYTCAHSDQPVNRTDLERVMNTATCAVASAL